MKKSQIYLLACSILVAMSCREPTTTAPDDPVPNFSHSTYTLAGGPFGSVMTVAGTVWVSQFNNGTVRKMDVATGTFSTTITVGAPNVVLPTALATNSNGTRLYVAAYGQTGGNGRVLMYDLTTPTPTLLNTYVLPGDANGIIAIPGDIVFVGLTNGNIYKLNLASGTQLAANTSLSVASGYHFALNQNKTVLYASSRDYGVYRLDANSLQGVIRMWPGKQPQGIVYSADWTKLYVAMQAGDIRIVEESSNDVVGTIATGGCRGFSLVYAKGLLYDSCVLDGKVVVVDPLANQIKATETVGGQPRELSYDPTTLGGKIIAPNDNGWVDRIDPAAIPDPRFVSATGSPGAGTIDAPWDLHTALTSATPGTTVWLRGGHYGPNTNETTLLDGSSAPIVFRQYPGERAQIDGRLIIKGKNLTFWGFEAMMSNPLDYKDVDWKPIYVYTEAVGIKLVDLVIHDGAGSGAIIYWTAGDVEMRGCIVYNNGTVGGHGVYVQASSGTPKQLVGNVIFNNLKFGVHAFSDNTAALHNITVTNNVLFNNGTIINNPKSNIIMGGTFVGNSDLTATSNVSYWSPSAASQGIGISMGYTDGQGVTAQGANMSVQSNILLGGKTGLVIKKWTTATVTNNVIGGPATNAQPTNPVVIEDPGLTTYNPHWTWNNNTYYHDGSLAHWIAKYQANPSGVNLATFLSATQFGSVDQATGSAYPAQSGLILDLMDPNRAFVWIYNPGGSSYAAANMGSFLSSCIAARIYNVQNVYGWIASAACPSSNVAFPMTGTPPPPRMQGQSNLAPDTGPWFQVFLVVKS